MDLLQDFGGTFRIRSPEETLRDLKPYARTIGISRIGNVTGLDTVGIPVWMAVRPLSRSLTVSQGKGIDHIAACVSAAMESVELYHAEHFVPEGELHDLRTAIASNDFVDPTGMPLRTDAKFQEGRAVRWIEARSVTSGRSTFVPREIVDRDSRVCQAKDHLFFSSSNGLASGNTVTEALIHGLCELVERDQITFWLISKEIVQSNTSSRLEIESIDDLHCARLIDQLLKAGLKIAIWRVSTTIQIPCFCCSIWDEDGATFYPQRASGSGCHPYKRVALSRAITEAAQSRLTHISGARDDMYWGKFRNTLPVHTPGNLTYHARMKSEPEAVRYDTIQEAPTIGDPRQMVMWISDAVKREVGSDPVYVDLSQPDSPFAVVQALCVGLEVSAKKALYTPGIRAMKMLSEIMPQ